jgi:transcriptional regulator with XRE-family HTH domain
MRPVVDPRFAATLRALRSERGLSLRDLARLAIYGKSYLHDLETGRKQPTAAVAERLDEVLSAGGRLERMVHVSGSAPIADADELAALELARRVTASDVSAETLERLEVAVDDLAVAYTTVKPELLLPRVRQHLGYVRRLVDGRTTLGQHRRLLIAGGWLSLLTATVLVDLRQGAAAAAHLMTADDIARHAEQPEIRAWVAETRAWEALTVGDYRHAVELSQQAERLAPLGSSIAIQATAQQGRAWARMGRANETRDALNQVARLVSPLPVPCRPEHHYRYDPAKALSYTATTLAWVGDPAAEDYARAAISQLEAAQGRTIRPRRVASAQLDLSLALLGAGRPDEAAVTALDAITSGRVVASNWWRVTEVLAGVERTGVSEEADLRDAYEAFRPVH